MRHTQSRVVTEIIKQKGKKMHHEITIDLKKVNK